MDLEQYGETLTWNIQGKEYMENPIIEYSKHGETLTYDFEFR